MSSRLLPVPITLGLSAHRSSRGTLYEKTFALPTAEARAEEESLSSRRMISHACWRVFENESSADVVGGQGDTFAAVGDEDVQVSPIR